MLRTMVKGGHKRRDQNNDLDRDDRDFRYILTNQRILELCNTDDISAFVRKQQTNYPAHLARQPNTALTKRLLFNVNKHTKQGRPIATLEQKVLTHTNMAADQFYKAAIGRKIGHDHPTGLERHKSSKK